jgi:RNA polymerase sigma factor (TIGR02999 family)
MASSSIPATGVVTDLLRAWGRGDASARDELFAHVYSDLRRRAARYLRRERREHTLVPTALVHETYLRLVDQTRASWKNRAQFFGVAAETMRRVLVDHARRRARDRRGGGWTRLHLDDALGAFQARGVELLALDEALTALAAFDIQQARIVELRFFAGLSVEDAAAVLGISTPTVKRDWKLAKTWLRRRLAAAASR